MSSITANISNPFFCSSFETGRIIPEVCCITKAAIKNVHFCTELSKVSAMIATSTCLFSCCNSSSVETTAGNSVTKMMIESSFSIQRMAQIGFSFSREEAEPETSLSTFTHFALHLLSDWRVSNSSPWLTVVNALANSILGRFHTSRTQRFTSWVWPMVRRKLGNRWKWKSESWFHYTKVLFVGVIGIAEMWFYLV